MDNPVAGVRDVGFHLGLEPVCWGDAKAVFERHELPDDATTRRLLRGRVSVGIAHRLSDLCPPVDDGHFDCRAGVDDGERRVLESGHRVVMAAPALDGSRIDLVLDESVHGRTAVPDFPEVDVHVNVTYGPAAVPATRNHAPQPARYSGAYMQDGALTCSTGFRVTEVATGQAGMVSAEHCGVTVGDQWYYSSSTDWLIGQFQGQMLPSAAGYFPDIAAWKGVGVLQQQYDRKCSSTIVYSPINDVFVSGYGVNYVP